ncbi:type IV pilus modification protein PilV [Variovorax sp.]|uniref:type IV pilus modification protein PilV n=1 Tax=Variovorax sp. TaxID=1871043 RepID=UPI003BACEB0B
MLKDLVAMRASSRIRPPRPHASSGRKSHHGIVLIEVLVALLIFMFGILGFIGLQTALVRAESEANTRANAAYLASELIGRMWADISNLSSYAGTDSCSATSCTEWRDKLALLLPGATAAITVGTGANAGNVSVRIQWALPGGSTRTYETQSNVSAKAAS